MLAGDSSGGGGEMVGVPGTNAGLDWSEDDMELDCKVVCGDEV